MSSQRLLRCRHGLQSGALSPRGSRPAGVGTSHCPAGATEKREQEDIIMYILMRDAEERKKGASKVKQSTHQGKATQHTKYPAPTAP